MAACYRIETRPNGSVVRWSQPKAGDLSEREKQVLRLKLEGYKLTAIASELGISWKTVVCHWKQCCDKLGARTPLQIAVIAVKQGLV